MARAQGSGRGKEGGSERVKTLAIRLDEDLHARLSVIALLAGSTVTDEIRTALEQHVASRSTDADLSARAEAARAEIERDAQARQQAIAEMFGNKPSGRGGKAADAQ